MYSSAPMAFLHHAAAFTLVAALPVEVALFKPPLSLVQAQRLVRTDNLCGASAGVLLAVGLLRVVYFDRARPITGTMRSFSSSSARSSSPHCSRSIRPSPSSPGIAA